MCAFRLVGGVCRDSVQSSTGYVRNWLIDWAWCLAMAVLRIWVFVETHAGGSIHVMWELGGGGWLSTVEDFSSSCGFFVEEEEEEEEDHACDI